MSAVLDQPSVNSLELAVPEGRERKLIFTLARSFPHAVKTSILMDQIGIKFSLKRGHYGRDEIRPHSAFVEFQNIRLRADAAIARHGYRIARDGGEVGSKLWLEQI